MSTSNGQSKIKFPTKNRDGLSGASDVAVFKAVGDSYAKLNETWAAAEADLLKFSVPTPVIHDIGCDEHETFHLGFVRHDGKWRICWGYLPHHSQPHDDWHWTPIAECPLAVRLSSVEHFGELREKVREAAVQTVADVQQAIAKLNFELT